MRAVVQRVRSARVEVAGEVVGEMDAGLLTLVGVGVEDTEADAAELARKIIHLRIFEDDSGKMNRSVVDVGGTVGLISQFTLYGDARRGRRPSYGAAAPPEAAQPLFESVVDSVRSQGLDVVTGRFGAEMEVSLVNHGPVTLLVDTDKQF